MPRAMRGSSSGLDEEAPLLHDLQAIDPDVEFASDHVDMRARVPLRASVLAIGIAEGDVNAGELLILQDVADHVFQFDVGADGELAHAIAILVSVGVFPEILLELLVFAEDLG